MSEWQPIETAPPGKYVLFDQASWRHPWVGRYTGVDGLVVLDNCDVAATQMDYHADVWMPLPPRQVRAGWGTPDEQTLPQVLQQMGGI